MARGLIACREEPARRPTPPPAGSASDLAAEFVLLGEREDPILGKKCDRSADADRLAYPVQGTGRVNETLTRLLSMSSRGVEPTADRRRHEHPLQLGGFGPSPRKKKRDSRTGGSDE